MHVKYRKLDFVITDFNNFFANYNKMIFKFNQGNQPELSILNE